MAVFGDTGDAGGVSIVAGKSLPLVRVALSLVTRVDVELAVLAAAAGLRADSAVCVLLSRMGGLVEDAAVAAAFVANVETGVAAGKHGLTAALLLRARLGAAPRTMSESLLLAVAAAGVVRAEELSSDTAPWPNDSSSRKPGKGGKAASSRSNLGASTSSLDLPLSALLPSVLLEPFSSFFLRRIRLSWYFCEEPLPPPESLPMSPLGLPLE